jgi:hypothetical protein
LFRKQSINWFYSQLITKVYIIESNDLVFFTQTGGALNDWSQRLLARSLTERPTQVLFIVSIVHSQLTQPVNTYVCVLYSYDKGGIWKEHVLDYFWYMVS